MFAVSSMTLPLKKVALKHPGHSLKTADPKKWHYSKHFDPKKVEAAHQSLVDHLRSTGVQIFWIDADDKGNADTVFTYDASLMTPEGAILMSPGKALRKGEQELHRSFYNAYRIPILGEISGNGKSEAGDTLWLDDQTLLIGRGFRTNAEGANQIKSILSKLGITCHIFDLPFYKGRDACLHLMSLVSLIDTKKALVCLPLLPINLWRFLKYKEFDLIPAPFEEFESSHTLSANVLALSPGECLMIQGFPKTYEILKDHGIQIEVFEAEALCVGCEGGPTCLTRPLLRA